MAKPQPPPPPPPPPRLHPSFRSDAEVLARHHRFIRTAEDDAHLSETNPAELRLARRYYDRLFKEYAIADLSLCQKRRDEERQLARTAADANAAAADDDAAATARRHLAALRAKPPPQIGLRWRTRAEVVSGRGHLSCGNRACTENAALSTFELPFRWRELGEHEPRAALVKVRLCPKCAALLPRRVGGGGGRRGGGGRSEEEGEEEDGRGRRRRERQKQEEEDEEEAGAAAGTRQTRPAAPARPARSRSRSPPSAAAAAAAAASDDGEGEEEDDARLDRMVQDMIDAFEAG